MSKRSNACEFSPKVRQEIKDRDGGCILCQMYGHTGFPASQIAHYVARSQGGLGIAKNGAYMCVVHHQELDNGKDGKKLKAAFRSYLELFYEDWSEEDLIYKKGV